MTEDIDYQVVARMLQEENERLRLAILKQRSLALPVIAIDLSTIKEFVEENYILLIVIFSLLSLLFTIFFSTIDVVGRYHAQRKYHHEG